jgi:hypothetical protein
MAKTYTIETAGEPISPSLLRELCGLLREDDDLDLGVKLKDRPPAPGEQGALPVAVEIISAAAPAATAFAGVLIAWMNKHKVQIKVRSGENSLELKTGDPADAERLIAMLKRQ